MKKTLVASSVIGAALSLSATTLTTVSSGLAYDKERCFGISKAGENGCASVANAGIHSCAHQSAVDYSGADWTFVPTGTCEKLGGKTKAFDGTGKPISN